MYLLCSGRIAKVFCCYSDTGKVRDRCVWYTVGRSKGMLRSKGRANSVITNEIT